MKKIHHKQSSIIFFTALSVVLYFFSVFFNSTVLNIFALLYLICVAFSLSSSLSQAWVFFLYVFGLFFAVISNGMVEYFSSYLTEIGEYAVLTGAAARNSFLIVIFFCCLFFMFNVCEELFKKPSKRVALVDGLAIKIMMIIGTLLIICMAYIIARYGSPLTMGMDRFSYWANVAPSWYRYATSLVPIFGFVVSFAREVGRLPSAFANSWLVLAVVLLVLGGEKFSGLLILIFFYFLPYFCIFNKRLSLRHVGLGMMFFVFAAMLVLANYYSIYGSAFLDMFEKRLALQGQMLFAIDKVSSEYPVNFDTILSNFFGLLGMGESGLSYLMYLVAPSEVVDRHLSGGATFTAPYPANISYFFGFYAAPILVAALGGVVGILGAGLYKAVKDKNFLLSILYLKAFFYVYIAIVMGEANRFLDWKMAVYLGAIALFLLIQSIEYRKNERKHISASGSV